MKQEAETATPLVLVHSATSTTYEQLIQDMLTTFMQRKLKGEDLDVMGAIATLDDSKDNSAVREWLSLHGLMTKAGFDRALSTIQKRKEVTAELGFYPEDVQHFVDEYATRNQITITPKGVIKRVRAYNYQDVVIDETAAGECDEARYVFNLANSTPTNLEDVARELRLVRDRLELKQFPDTSIRDALASWAHASKDAAKINTFLAVKYEKGKATGPVGTDMWRDLEESCFDVRSTAPGFVNSILKKFIWQVKRKALGLPVTNHLMPVLTGAQGKGKSTFVEALCGPLEDVKVNVDFKIITDGKSLDIWKNYIMFIDEMGFFSKADVDTVKNNITASEITFRGMHTNSNLVVTQSATFIGCSNKSLGQLIRDETGLRRFAELEWSNTPDWTVFDRLDWTLLWQSVDETGADPVTPEFKKHLTTQQTLNRNMGSVEMWAREHGSKFKDWSSATSMHEIFRMWEKESFPRMDTSIITFGRTMQNLINTYGDEFGWESKDTRKGKQYRFEEPIL